MKIGAKKWARKTGPFLRRTNQETNPPPAAIADRCTITSLIFVARQVADLRRAAEHFKLFIAPSQLNFQDGERHMTPAFSGIRIIDFTQVLAGPFATQQLALLGAEVIKIEQPGQGDQTRGLMNDAENAAEGMSPAFMTCNLGKRSITLDLKAPSRKRDRLSTRRSIRRCGGELQSRRDATLRVRRRRPAADQTRSDLLFHSPAMAQQGPKSGVAAYDGAIQADSGMMAITGYPATGPTRTGYMPVDMATALNAAFAISGCTAS